MLGLLALFTSISILNPSLPAKILSGVCAAFLWFCLINTTIHHHQTYRNAAASDVMKKVLDVVYLFALPNAPKRKIRYTRAHLNHHLRPFHETDVDHHYGTQRFLKMMQNPASVFWYFLELTFVGAHMPGWEDARYMNEVPLEDWNREDYETMKQVERKKAIQLALLQWGSFSAVLGLASLDWFGQGIFRIFTWGWAFPMLLVKNWEHFLGQFQHYQESFLQKEISYNQCTKTFRIPGWLNYLAAGELSGHFLHHLYPEMPYYKVESARRLFAQDSERARLFVIH